MSETGRSGDGVAMRFVRHATFVLGIGGHRILVDPMLNPAGAVDAVPDTPNGQRNPLVGLPFGDEELGDLLSGIDAVLVTHTHGDHWDARAAEAVPKGLPVFCQPEDEAVFADAGFVNTSPVASELRWEGIRLLRTGGEHGTGEIARAMAPVSGFILRPEDGPAGGSAGGPDGGVYVAGDTVWCPPVEEALEAHGPAVVVVNAGAARFLEGDPITMTADDVASVCRAAPGARVVAVHMEAINHCLLSRAELREALRREGLEDRITVPADGDIIEGLA